LQKIQKKSCSGIAVDRGVSISLFWAHPRPPYRRFADTADGDRAIRFNLLAPPKVFPLLSLAQFQGKKFSCFRWCLQAVGSTFLGISLRPAFRLFTMVWWPE
jgi:hypothetical protein